MGPEVIQLAYKNVMQPSREIQKPFIRPEFLKLVAKVSRDTQNDALHDSTPQNKPTTLVSGVDKLLATLRTDSSPILPRVDILNEAARVYLNAGIPTSAIELISTMKSSYGIKPDTTTMELLALAQFRAGDSKQALDLVMQADHLGDDGQDVVDFALKELFKRDEDGKAWALFNELCLKGVPSPKVSATMIKRCGKLDQVEKAFLLYKNLTAQGLGVNPACSSALIYAASKRKEYFPTAIDLFRQMELLKMPIGISVYNNLLYACSKSADLNTAMSLWRDTIASSEVSMRPNVFTCTNYIWALASVENSKSKLSKRNFLYQVNSLDIAKAVDEVYEYMGLNGIPINSHVMSAMLAVYSNNKLQKRAEELFWNKYAKLGLSHDPFSYELMLKLYDNVSNYEAAEKVYNEFKDRDIKIPYEGWRALCRTAALCNRLEESITHIVEMKEQGYNPYQSDLRVVRLRLIERERRDLVSQFDLLCTKDTRSQPNPFVPWLGRSQAIGDLLKTSFGKDAPKVATRIVPKEKK